MVDDVSAPALAAVSLSMLSQGGPWAALVPGGVRGERRPVQSRIRAHFPDDPGGLHAGEASAQDCVRSPVHRQRLADILRWLALALPNLFIL